MSWQIYITSIVCLSSTQLALAQADTDTNEPAQLAPVVVVATKTARPVGDVAGSVTVVEAYQLADRLSIDIADIVRYTPGIALPRSTTRFGWDSYSLRGVGGNRVAIEVDGIPVGGRFEIGNYSNAGRDVVDIDLLKRVEVLYGPASTLYGSDALGGVVAYYTLDPGSLASVGDPYLAASAGFRGDQDALNARLSGAWATERLAAMLSWQRRRGEQRDASAAGSTAQDHQEWDSDSLFGKFNWELGEQGRLTATVEQTQRQTDTDIQSLLGNGRFRSTSLLLGDDEQQRQRLSVRYAFEGPKFDGRVLLFDQDTETRQLSIEERASLDLRRTRLFEFDQHTTGVEFNATSRFDTGSVSHTLTYGIEMARTRTSELRSGFQTTLAGGDYTNLLLGEVFPVRDFPVSRDVEAGVFVHDEIQLGNLTLIPALRYDDYRLRPRPDTVYLEDNPGADIVAIDESQATPRLGAVYKLGGGWSVFGQYARGFRAPPFADANIGLDIPLFNIRALPNPDLDSETSQGFEIGLRRFAGSDEFSLTAHYTDYENFIESRAFLGPDPATGVLLFQSRNLGEARIYGAEVRWRQRLGRTLGLHGALAWTRGENELTGEPINMVDPAELVLGLDWHPNKLPLTAQLSWTLVDRQDRFTDPDDELVGTAGFGVVDVTARYSLPGATVRAGVFNVFDKVHWRWSSVRGVPVDDPTRPLLSEPGRYAGVSLLFEW
ncbi:MAG: TonB-dependent receptor [Gammaproteobacteria bacterium]|nr:TonB-dependent receptor [Gammaproteobacteria bacterium]